MLPHSLSRMRYFRFRDPVLIFNTECRTNLRERSTTYAAARTTSGERDTAMCEVRILHHPHQPDNHHLGRMGSLKPCSQLSAGGDVYFCLLYTSDAADER